MADKKQLIVVIEGTGAMGRHWRTIFSDYLQKLIRSFRGDLEANPDGPIVELAIVRFNVHGNNSPFLVQRGGWVRNLDYYFDTLAAMPFGGGNFCDAAIAEGLAEVLMMFPPPKEGQIQQNGGLQRHCILVAASNPFPLSTPVYRPPDSRGEPQSRLCNAETLVKSFPQCYVSLSVICPRQLPKLKSLYYAAKRDPSAADHTINIVTNPHYLVLISDDFKSACADLSQLGITILPSDHTEAQIIRCAPANSSAQSSITSMSQLLVLPGQQFLQSGTSTSENMMKGVVQFDMPALRALQSSQSGYVKLWEGDLTCERHNQTVFLTRLQAYRKLTDSASLAEDWPSTMHFDKTISWNNKIKMNRLVEKVYFLAFVAMNQHQILNRLREKKYCAVIRLPSQTLMLSVFHPESMWTGTLFLGHGESLKLQSHNTSEGQRQRNELLGHEQVSPPDQKA